MVTDTFSEEYIVFNIFKLTCFYMDSFEKTPGKSTSPPPAIQNRVKGSLRIWQNNTKNNNFPNDVTMLQFNKIGPPSEGRGA
jgi:hypothetical protein